jgi:isopenicillin-N N-acyltransferase-like protein
VPIYIEEMHTASPKVQVCPFEDVVLLNARTEILKLAERSGEDDPDGCTGIVVLPQATKAGRLIHGRR